VRVLLHRIDVSEERTASIFKVEIFLMPELLFRSYFSVWNATKLTSTEANFGLLYQACMTDYVDDDDTCRASGGMSD
jgi:hypothetical protein